MSNLHNLQPTTIPPYVVLNTLQENVKKIKAIFVVSFEMDDDGSEGTRPTVYASGDLSDCCTAAISLQSFAQRVLRGEVIPE